MQMYFSCAIASVDVTTSLVYVYTILLDTAAVRSMGSVGQSHTGTRRTDEHNPASETVEVDSQLLSSQTALTSIAVAKQQNLFALHSFRRSHCVRRRVESGYRSKRLLGQIFRLFCARCNVIRQLLHAVSS